MKITENRKWYADDVRYVCVNNELYTRGCVHDYAFMLDEVNRLEPTNENIYSIAKDIVRHSEDQTIQNVMFLLANQAVRVSYDIEDE